MPAAAAGALEPAGELKFGQVGLANLRVLSLEIERLAAEMRERVLRAPRLFARAPVVVDFGSLSACPDAATARTLLDALRDAGVLPVGLAFGAAAVEALAVELSLPVLARFRAQYERPPAAQAPDEAPAHPEAQVEAQVQEAHDASAPGRPPATGALQHAQPVRSGQQVYAHGRDLIVTATVGAGAEVIADGCVHVYGSLRGRALAGARGDTGARIFCRDFQAELVAIAGHYRVLEEIPAELRGRSVQVWLQGESLCLRELG
ncbi:MAG TPA: septum site-determining protein MinC [Xanthomonadaceae bacterium]|nr:septum site-determining protein MinC [Xanthomonadaceae bacterium]